MPSSKPDQSNPPNCNPIQNSEFILVQSIYFNALKSNIHKKKKAMKSSEFHDSIVQYGQLDDFLLRNLYSFLSLLPLRHPPLSPRPLERKIVVGEGVGGRC